jgi:sec-independent protein translocase protein TatA
MGFSTTELVIILVIVVLLFGAKKIPELAKGIGGGIKSFKNEMKDVDDSKTESVADNSKKEEIKPTEPKKEA